MSLLLSGLRRAESRTVLTATQLALVPSEYPFLAQGASTSRGLGTYLVWVRVGQGVKRWHYLCFSFISYGIFPNGGFEMETKGTITDIHGLFNMADSTQNSFGTEVWWRGQADAKWKLTPHVYREGEPFDLERTLAVKFINMAPFSTPPLIDLLKNQTRSLQS